MLVNSDHRLAGWVSIGRQSRAQEDRAPLAIVPSSLGDPEQPLQGNRSSTWSRPQT